MYTGQAQRKSPMPDPQVFEKAEALARLPRNQASTPFARDGNTANWYFADIATREQTLLAVKDIIDGNWAPHIDPFPGETYREAQKRPGQVRFQSLKAWIERRNTTYDEEPSRKFYRAGVALADDDPLVEAIGEVYRAMNVNEHLNQCEREIELYGNVVLLPSYDSEFREPLLDRYISPRVRVVENSRNPKRPYATVLTGTDIERDRQMRARLVGVADAWVTAIEGVQQGFYRAFRPSADSDWEPLRTPHVPLVHCWDAQPTSDTGYYIDPLGVALAKLNVCINEDFLSRFGYTVLMQAHGQMVIIGHDDQNPITIGPGRAIKFSGMEGVTQDVRFAQPGADLVGMQQAIEYLLRELRDVYGIPASEIDVGQDASGRSRIEARAVSAATRKAKHAKMRDIETRLFRAVLMTQSAFNPDFPSIDNVQDYDVAVTYPEPAVSLSVQDKIAMEQHEIALGIVTPGELLLKRKPDAFDSAEEADAALADRRPAVDESRDGVDGSTPEEKIPQE